MKYIVVLGEGKAYGLYGSEEGTLDAVSTENQPGGPDRSWVCGKQSLQRRSQGMGKVTVGQRIGERVATDDLSIGGEKTAPEEVANMAVEIDAVGVGLP